MVSFTTFAQVKISPVTGTPNPAAMLEVESTNRGFLLPRIALTSSAMQLNNTNPIEGIMVFNTNDISTNDLMGVGVYIYHSGKWRLILRLKDLDPVGAYKCSIKDTIGGYLKCDGSAVSRSVYADLFALIGTSFGSGDGTSTFNLPDFKGRLFGCIGVGQGLTQRNLGNKSGSETNVLTAAQMPSHQHRESLAAAGNDGAFGNTSDESMVYVESISGSPNMSGYVALTDNVGGGSHNEMQPTIFAGNYFIKY